MAKTQRTFGGFTSKRSSANTSKVFQTTTIDKKPKKEEAFLTGLHHESSMFDDAENGFE